MVALIGFATVSQPRWPSLREIGAIALATAGMAAALWPMRGWTPGVLTLVTQIFTGALVFGALALAFDIARLRAPLIAKIRSLLHRGAEAEAASKS